MQTAPPTAHAGVAALAVPVAAALTPPTIVSVAKAASTCLLIDSSWVDDEVTTDLLPEDLRLRLVVARRLLVSVCPSRPCGPWPGRGSLKAVRPGSPTSSAPEGRTARPTGRAKPAAPTARRSRSA